MLLYWATLLSFIAFLKNGYLKDGTDNSENLIGGENDRKSTITDQLERARTLKFTSKTNIVPYELSKHI